MNKSYFSIKTIFEIASNSLVFDQTKLTKKIQKKTKKQKTEKREQIYRKAKERKLHCKKKSFKFIVLKFLLVPIEKQSKHEIECFSSINSIYFYFILFVFGICFFFFSVLFIFLVLFFAVFHYSFLDVCHYYFVSFRLIW